MRRVVARAPTRIDFGGGWTDVPPYPAEQGGCVCNLAIARYAVVSMVAAGEMTIVENGVPIDPGDPATLAAAAVRRAGAHNVALALKSEFPRGAGLGGSSAAGVALQAALAAWCGDRASRAQLAERSRALEVEELHVPGGCQDHYAAAFGGALGLRLDGRVHVQPIPLDAARVTEIERRCIVVYTGESRISGATITAVLDAYRARVPGVTAALSRMAALAGEMIDALQRGALDDLAALVDEHWTHQRALHETITTPTIERVLAAARAAGAQGGKALGASGGGCVLVIAPSDRAVAVRRALDGLAEPLPFTVDLEGARVVAAE